MEQFVASRNGRLWTTASGAGIPMLLCNGGPGCCDYLEPLGEMVDDICKVIRFEQSGCGRSDHNPPYTIDACLADLESIRVHYDIDRWIIAGHSWGADLALMYALKYPSHCDGFVCISGGRFHNDREWHKQYEAGRDKERDTLPDFRYPPNMEVNRQGNLSWKQYIQRSTLWKELAELETPGLFIYGENDIRPSWPVEQVASLLPNARFTLVPGADHNIWISHSDDLRKLLRAYLTSLSEE